MIGDQALGEALEGYRRRCAVPGVAVAVFDCTGPVAAQARGVRSLEDPGAALTVDTLFRVYSVAKSLTASVVGALVDTREADLDEPVAATLPGFALRGRTDGHRVTLRHLLSHRAGFVPDMVLHDGCGRDPDAIGRAAVEESRRTPVLAGPGQVYSYSNLGFTVVGHVAEKRTGVPFGELVRERLLAPLGMDRTTHDPAVAATHPLLQHHGVDARGRLSVRHEARVAAKHAPSSQCWSTVLDMARFGAAQLTARAARAGAARWSPATVRELHRPHADPRLDVRLRYGLGFYLGPRDGGVDRVGHEGFYDGMWCKLLCCPAAGVGLVWADNRGEELREERYQVIDALLAGLGVGSGRWDRDEPAPTGESAAPAGHYERPASVAALQVHGDADRVVVRVGREQVALAASAPGVWSAPAPPDAVPPWRPHAGSRRISLGAAGGPPGGPGSHVLLNGLPFRRQPAAR